MCLELEKCLPYILLLLLYPPWLWLVTWNLKIQRRTGLFNSLEKEHHQSIMIKVRQYFCMISFKTNCSALCLRRIFAMLINSPTLFFILVHTALKFAKKCQKNSWNKHFLKCFQLERSRKVKKKFQKSVVF